LPGDALGSTMKAATMSVTDDIRGILAVDREARQIGFRAGFVIACVELHKTHGEDSLAFYLLRDAGIGRDAALAAVERDDHDAINAIFKSNT
jgi:hypothetical protein